MPLACQDDGVHRLRAVADLLGVGTAETAPAGWSTSLAVELARAAALIVRFIDEYKDRQFEVPCDGVSS